MQLSSVVYLILITAVTSFSQVINLSGTVTNQTGKPIKNAKVTLIGKSLTDTTGTDGKFSLSGGQSSVTSAFPMSGTQEISLNHGLIKLYLLKPAQVSIDLFGMNGNLLESVLRQKISAGEYRYNLTSSRFATRMMIIRISVGQRVSTFRYLPVSGVRNTVVSSLSINSSDAKLSKLQAVVDSLKISAAGYAIKVVTLSSYEGDVNVKLDTMNLPLFSFFVTSLKAVQDLSGNPLGFGGDLRFGKTGPGAGLLGADSICQCIAEKSMPGSKAKQWRAFLSVSSGPDGQPVNARDRIGTGPWYDRLGRMLAPNLTDLLKPRPLNGDPAIQNDLPNEEGIPNQYPDGEKQDNHHMVTGSDKDGKLISTNTTCEDWTSAAKSTGARSGLSFPRGFGGIGGMGKTQFSGGDMDNTNWISAFNAPGCKPGTDLDGKSMGGKPGDDFIGSGGGYGGFYCFSLVP